MLCSHARRITLRCVISNRMGSMAAISRRHTLDAGRCEPRTLGEPLTAREAERAAALFRELGGETRLRLLHSIVEAGERSVTELAEDVGLSVQATSNQLTRMVDRGIVETRREGVRIFYRVVDPCIPTLLDSGLCLARGIDRGGTTRAAATGQPVAIQRLVRSGTSRGKTRSARKEQRSA